MSFWRDARRGYHPPLTSERIHFTKGKWSGLKNKERVRRGEVLIVLLSDGIRNSGFIMAVGFICIKGIGWNGEKSSVGMLSAKTHNDFE